jgi:hypothetical protein
MPMPRGSAKSTSVSSIDYGWLLALLIFKNAAIQFSGYYIPRYPFSIQSLSF